MTRRDILFFALLLLLAGGLRGYQLSQPGGHIFDEWGYARDACSYLGLGEQTCGVSTEVTDEHPPLGKWLIAAGIGILGNNPIGWRVPSALAGIITVGLLYLLTRRLTGSTLAAVVAAGMLAFDPLSIVSSRVAMLDVFTACAGVATVLFVVLERDAIAASVSRPRSLRRPWLAATGIAGGCAIATKWSGALVLVTVVVLVVLFEVATARRAGRSAWSAFAAGPAIGVWLVMAPAVVYAASYIGRLDATLIAIPWQDGAWPRELLERQLFMLRFHAGLGGAHPYASPAWAWLLGKRPVLFYFDIDGAGRYREILALANPFLWIPGLLCAVAAGVSAVRGRRLFAAEAVVAAAAAGAFLPWLLLTAGRSFVFLYYVLPTVPFLALALGWATIRLAGVARPAMATGVFVIAVTAVLFWQPLIYGHWLDYDTWRQRILFVDCTPSEITDGRLTPRFRGPPPPGWCWV